MATDTLNSFGEQIRQAAPLIAKRLLKEKLMRGEDYILADDKGRIYRMSPEEMLARHPELKS